MTSTTQLFIVWASPAGSVYLRHTLGNILSFVKEKVSEKDIYLQIFLALVHLSTSRGNDCVRIFA